MALQNKIEPALRELKLTAPQYGGMVETELCRLWRDPIKQFHPDRPENRARGGDADQINAAYDTRRQT
jgi:hypothetical protein